MVEEERGHQRQKCASPASQEHPPVLDPVQLPFSQREWMHGLIRGELGCRLDISMREYAERVNVIGEQGE
jgi:hypothetical protein